MKIKQIEIPNQIDWLPGYAFMICNKSLLTQAKSIAKRSKRANPKTAPVICLGTPIIN